MKTLKKIELKPEMTLAVDQRSFTFPEIPLLLNLAVENKGSHPLMQISFLQHLPEEIKLMRLPEGAEKIMPGETLAGSIELTPSKPGYYRLQPIEVYFEDEDGNKYVKASNEVSVEVVEPPPTDYKRHMTAVDTYLKYGKNQEENSNYFHAGDGYRQAADVYNKFNSDSRVVDYYFKAVENYRQYYEERQGDLESHDSNKIKRLADALWFSAECNRKSDRLQNASKDYLQASEVYEKASVQKREILAKSFHEVVEGKIKAKHGQYLQAIKLLEKGLADLDQAIKEGGFEGGYVKTLEKFEDEARLVLKQVRERPEIGISMKPPTHVPVNNPFKIPVRIKNTLDEPILEVRPVLKRPEEFETVTKPGVYNQVLPGQEVDATFTLYAHQPGEYEFKPLDVSYKTRDGKRYIQGSRNLELTVITSPSSQGEKKVGYEPEVDLRVDPRVVTFKGLSVVLNVSVENKSDIPLTEILYIANLPQGLSAGELPDKIDLMEPGEKSTSSVEVYPDESGVYHAKPIEVYYMDPAGKKYVVDSNEASIEVNERPPEDYDNHANAVEEYLGYAKVQRENKNYYLTANGYREAARVYGKFNSDNTLESYLRDSIKYYNEYIENNKTLENKNVEKRRCSVSLH